MGLSRHAALVAALLGLGGLAAGLVDPGDGRTAPLRTCAPSVAGAALMRIQASGASWSQNRLRARFTSGGVNIELDGREARLGPVAVWREGGALHALDRSAVPRVHGNRVDYPRGNGVTEWYVNGPLGLEQGVTLETRPAGEGNLVVALAETRAPAPRAAYSLDARGRALPTRTRTGYDRLLAVVDDSDATYPIVVDPLFGTKTQLDDGPPGAQVGAIALSQGWAILALNGGGGGNHVAAWQRVGPGAWGGVPASAFWDGDSNSASASVAAGTNFLLTGYPAVSSGALAGGYVQNLVGWGSWSPAGKIYQASPWSPTAEFGSSVVTNGTTLVAVGAAGTQYVEAYVDVGNYNWSEEAQFFPDAYSPLYGRVLALDGSTLAAVGDKVYLYRRSLAGAWSVEQKLGVTASSVALQGDTLVLGDQDAAPAGKVYIYTRSATTWTSQTTLAPADGGFGDHFGVSVAIDGGLIAIGAYAHDHAGAIDTGGVYVYQGSGSSWSPVTELSGGANQGIGRSVALDGPMLLTQRQDQPSGVVYESTASPNGTTCSTLFECQSGYCAEGHCCDAACGGTCQSCLGAKTGKPDGTCAPVTAGTDPDAECSDDGVASCTTPGLDGYCDGGGACQKYDSTACQPSPCTKASECTNGFCAKEPGATSGICCDKSCNGKCESCLAAKQGVGGKDGVCKPIQAGTDPRNECDADTGNICGADGFCDGTAKCRPYALATTACGTTTCTGGTISGKLCDGSGQCAQNTTKCDPYGCDDALLACLSTCATSSHCVSGAFCASNATCNYLLPDGTPSTDPKQCESGILADGVCCAKACGGICEACDAPSSPGVCVPIQGPPRAGHGSCPSGTGSDPCGAALCNGVDIAECKKFVGTDVLCQPATCAQGVAHAAAYCDGVGKCAVTPSDDCGAYACGATQCKTSCSADADCEDQSTCDAGKCVSSAKCSADGHTLSGPSGDYDCTPFRCTSAGVCVAACASSADCVAGLSCSSSGACQAPAPKVAVEESGCGCRTLRGENGPSRAALLGLCALLLMARRRLRPFRNARD